MLKPILHTQAVGAWVSGRWMVVFAAHDDGVVVVFFVKGLDCIIIFPDASSDSGPETCYSKKNNLSVIANSCFIVCCASPSEVPNNGSVGIMSPKVVR